MNDLNGTNRPSIPEDIKRSVRQRCGFGCVICGLPIYHYDHIVEYSQEKVHEENNITLLCPNHHDLKTRGRIPRETIVEHNNTPHNITNKATSPCEIISFQHHQNSVQVTIGTHNFYYDFSGFDRFIIFSVDGQQLLYFSKFENKIFFNCLLFNIYNELVLEIINNEMVHSSELFDIKYEGTKLTVKSTQSETLIMIKFDLSGKIEIEKAVLYCNGVKMMVKDGVISTNDLGCTPERGGIIMNGTINSEGVPCIVAVGRPVYYITPIKENPQQCHITSVPCAMLHSKVSRYPSP